MAKGKTAAKRTSRAAAPKPKTESQIIDEAEDSEIEDGDLDNEFSPEEIRRQQRIAAEGAARAAQPARPRTRMVEVKRTLRYSKAYQYPEGHPQFGEGRVFNPGEEDEIPDDFPDGPHWSDWPLPDAFKTIDQNGREVSLLPEGVDPSVIEDRVMEVHSDAADARARKAAKAALGPAGARR